MHFQLPLPCCYWSYYAHSLRHVTFLSLSLRRYSPSFLQPRLSSCHLGKPELSQHCLWPLREGRVQITVERKKCLDLSIVCNWCQCNKRINKRKACECIKHNFYVKWDTSKQHVLNSSGHVCRACMQMLRLDEEWIVMVKLTEYSETSDLMVIN